MARMPTPMSAKRPTAMPVDQVKAGRASSRTPRYQAAPRPAATTRASASGRAMARGRFLPLSSLDRPVSRKVTKKPNKPAMSPSELAPSGRGRPPRSVFHNRGQFSKCQTVGQNVGGQAMISASVLNVPRMARINGVNRIRPTSTRTT
jgi:hypothetical protein